MIGEGPDRDPDDHRNDAKEAAEAAEAAALAARKAIKRSREVEAARLREQFPPGVSLRIDPASELKDAHALIPAAKQVLARGLALVDTGQPLVRLLQPGSDGSLIHVFLNGPAKHVYIQAGRVIRRREEEEEKVKPVEVDTYLMLNGVVRPGTLIEEGAHEFHPTAMCAEAYGLKYEFQDMQKLAVEGIDGFAQARFPKPSQYSGAMKRVVQALYGIGKTKAGSVAQDLAGRGTLIITNPYLYHFNVTHGIWRDLDAKVWLVEISRERGVLKMPLPVIPGTDKGSFENQLEKVGDTESLDIVLEFAGLPSGETFPTGDADLKAALEAGEVIRVASANDLLPFYKVGEFDKLALYTDCGWAFSDTGRVQEAHNCAFWYEDFNFATQWRYLTGGNELLADDPEYPGAIVAPLSKRTAHAEHWKFGPGLELVESSLFAGTLKEATFDAHFNYQELFRDPTGFPIAFWGRPPNRKLEEIWAYQDLDCPVHVYFNGDVLEIVRHQPQKNYTNGFVSGTQWSTASFGGSVLAETIVDVEYVYDYQEFYDGTTLLGATWKQHLEETGVYTFDISPRDYLQRLISYTKEGSFGNGIFTGPGYGPPENPVIGGLTGPEWKDPPPHYVPLIPGFYGQADPKYDAQYSHSVATIITLAGIDYPIEPVHWTRRWPITFERAGAFYTTFFDIRRNEACAPVTNESDINHAILHNADNWLQYIGAAIPKYLREGVLFTEWRGGARLNSIEPIVVENLPERLKQYLRAPGLDPVAFFGSEYTYTLDQYDKLRQAFTFSYDVVLNAGPTPCGITQDGVNARFFQTFPTVAIIQITPLPTYTNYAGGIPVADCVPVSTTFVGAV